MFKVGDKVRVREDLEEDLRYGGCYVTSDMMQHVGKEDTITSIAKDIGYGNRYKLSCDNRRNWSDEMLEKVEVGGKDMTALEYLEIKKRMRGFKDADCRECKLGDTGFCCDLEMSPCEAVEIVQKWGEEHPVKTLKDKLLEKFPNAQLRDDGTPAACAQDLGLITAEECEEISCVECWNRPYVDEFEEWLNA